MKKLLYESPFWSVYWHDEQKIIHFVFTNKTYQMSETEYLHDLQQYIPFLHKYKPNFILADTRDFKFTITPEIQIWINENILKTYAEVGVHKHAVLVSSDIFAMVSVEQTMEEDQGAFFQNAYFEQEEMALAWLGVH